MKCHEFNQNLNALAYARLMDAATRDAAQRHADECGRCAARLRNERIFSAALQTAARAETEQAPAHLKTALLAAFAQHQTAPVIYPERNRITPKLWLSSAIPNLKSEISKAPAFSVISNLKSEILKATAWAWMPRPWLAAAAAVAVCTLLGLAALRWQKTPEPSLVAQTQPVTPSAPPDATTPPVVPATAKVKEKRTYAVSQRVAFTPPAKNAAPPVVKARPVSRPAKAVAPTVEAPTELVTEYIPLTYVTAPTAMESGQIVRIAMPRSSAVALGLPAHLEERQETIKADVVLGDDGLARQIRFVYQPDGNRKMNR